jgi:hypothetical protein
VGVSWFRVGTRESTLASVPRYLVESYVAESPAAFANASARARRTAELGEGVDYVHTTFLPEDETVLHLFEAPSVEALDRAGRLAGLQFERIVRAIEDSADQRKESGR